MGFIDHNSNEPKYFVSPTILSSQFHSPQAEHLENLEQVKNQVLSVITENYINFSQDCLEKFNANRLFFLLENFCDNVPLNENGEISIFDTYKIKAARAVIQHNRQKEGHQDNLLINIDISGIQKFIYTIISADALKNLRTRSFFIELLCYYIIDQVLQAFQLHHANILMNGCGSIYVLTSQPENFQQILEDIDYNISRFLLEEFNGRLYADFAYVKCNDKQLEKDINEVLNYQRKFLR